jgi:hypothetical protein
MESKLDFMEIQNDDIDEVIDLTVSSSSSSGSTAAAVASSSSSSSSSSAAAKRKRSGKEEAKEEKAARKPPNSRGKGNLRSKAAEALKAMIERAKAQAAIRLASLPATATESEREAAGLSASTVALLEAQVVSDTAGAPTNTLAKYFGYQQHFRTYAQEQKAANEPIWADGDIVSQDKILKFVKYWCTERLDGDTVITLRKESHKGVMSALVDLYRMQVSLKVHGLLMQQ